MVSILLLLLVCGFSYLLGSIPFGLLVARWFGKIDIRTMGSGNIGATNVGRVMGLRWFVVVFVLDALKGLLPTGLGMWLASGLGLWQSSAPLREVSMTLVPVLAGLAAVLGHMFPCWLGFRGGKGVATALGGVVVLAPWASLAAALLFGVSFAIWRTVSVSSILAAISFGVLQMFLLQPHPWTANLWPLGIFSLLVPLLIVYRHRSNIARLLRGEEHAFRKSATGIETDKPASPTE